ncbi:MAG: lipopolysaccharide heptosyltransferase II [Candidatus Acidiferrales bacterium]
MKILVRATNWVGDAVMSLPALEAIRQREPHAHIAVLARPWVAELYRDQGFADQLIVFDHAGRHAGFAGIERLAEELRREKFDVALLLQNAFQAAWIVWRAGIRQRIGYARDRRSWLLTQAVPPPQPGEIPSQEPYYYLEMLRRAGWLEQLPMLSAITLRVPEGARQLAEASLLAAGARQGSRRVAMAPGAAFGAARRWPVERYAALADRAMAEMDADVILLGSAADRDTAQRIALSMRGKPVVLAGHTAIGEMPALLRACHAFVGNDSGSMHVAAATGVATIGVFGPTDPQATAPLSHRFTIVREPVECSPCFLRECPVDHRCMTRISVDRVFDALRASLLGYGR